MGKKLTGKALAKFEAERDVWKEVMEGVKEIKTGGGKRTKVQPTSQVVRVRCARRFKFDPPCRLNSDPGAGVDRVMVDCG